MQIHKKRGDGGGGRDMFALGSLADKTSSTVHHKLKSVYNFFEEYQPTGNYSNLNETVHDM